jgi:AraC-like DNA-binding protein
LEEAGLTVQQIEDRDARFSVESQIKFLELAAGSLADPFLGFHLARYFDLRQIGLLHYVLASSEAVGEALQRAVRYSSTVNEAASLEYRGRDELAIVTKYVGVARLSDRHQIEFWITVLVRECRELTGRDLSPRRVTLTHRRHEDCSELNAFLGTTIEFGAPDDEVIFPSIVKDMPVVGADPYLSELLITYSEEVLAQRSQRSGSLRAAVENALAPLLPHGKARIDVVARRLGISERTLARRLAAEGQTFSGVLNQLRVDLARRHISDSTLSISQIAWLLGYGEVSAFTHAFKRWTGTTPRETRARETPASG